MFGFGALKGPSLGAVASVLTSLCAARSPWDRYTASERQGRDCRSWDQSRQTQDCSQGEVVSVTWDRDIGQTLCPLSMVALREQWRSVVFPVTAAWLFPGQ